jgi:hypothetical protein
VCRRVSARCPSVRCPSVVQRRHGLVPCCYTTSADRPELMWYTADVADTIRKAAAYGFGEDEGNAYIHRLNGI